MHAFASNCAKIQSQLFLDFTIFLFFSFNKFNNKYYQFSRADHWSALTTAIHSTKTGGSGASNIRYKNRLFWGTLHPPLGHLGTLLGDSKLQFIDSKMPLRQYQFRHTARRFEATNDRFKNASETIPI